ncbi:MAG: hypothetical protein LBR91_01815 [Puniceicoccales bacterium]|jgi:hypothetical protein|nr:hypothetical protein [Puniceicoccales bacterium]
MGSEVAFVVMAAGIGRRYGGNGTKQLRTFGKRGLTISEYNILYALDSGFERFYFVVADEFAEIFHRRLKNFLPSGCTFDLIYQKKENKLLKFCRRYKPWGTAHAVMCCGNAIDCNFAVTNGDDLYGSDAIFRAAEFLKSADTESATFANIAYTLSETLSAGGVVSRGVIIADENSRLLAIDEVGQLSGLALEKLHIERESPVSMNLWCFTPMVFPLLRHSWSEFSSKISDVTSDEFGLPFFINAAVKCGKCRVDVIRTASKWHGITYKTDDETMESILGA